MLLSSATSRPVGCMVEKSGGSRAALHQLYLKPGNGGSAMKVKEVMHKGVDWVSPTTPATELAKLMWAHDIGCIPIGEDDRLIGMVTDRDIVCKGLASNNFDTRRATARDVMTEGIHCCREDDDLAKAVHHMEKLQLRRLPVINKSKRMVGILSLGDISHSVSGDMLSECVKSVSAHH
jgi:CBS domain-containing protein